MLEVMGKNPKKSRSKPLMNNFFECALHFECALDIEKKAIKKIRLSISKLGDFSDFGC